MTAVDRKEHFVGEGHLSHLQLLYNALIIKRKELHYKIKQNHVFLKEILPHPKHLSSRHYEEQFF